MFYCHYRYKPGNATRLDEPFARKVAPHLIRPGSLRTQFMSRSAIDIRQVKVTNQLTVG